MPRVALKLYILDCQQQPSTACSAKQRHPRHLQSCMQNTMHATQQSMHRTMHAAALQQHKQLVPNSEPLT
jgi:hypothetical protein